MHPALELDRQRLGDFCRTWGISELALFGSAVRDDFRPDSDIDVLVTFAPRRRHGLFEMVRMQQELQGIFGRKVDLVERQSIERSENYIRRKHILNSLVPIHVA
jgi:uncharacterized protein